jgi:hypothetical protein
MTPPVGDAGIGNDNVQVRNAVSGFENVNGGLGVGIYCAVELYDYDGAVLSFRQGLERFGGGARGVADCGYDGGVWSREVSLGETLADS